MMRKRRQTPERDGVTEENSAMPETGEKLQKALAQAGFGSRREMEEWIAAGRVSVNGEPATLGMRVFAGDLVKTERRTLRIGQRERETRILLYHKPEGEIVSRDDPGGRASVFDKLPKIRGQKWIAIGRLDFNTSGLLIFTTSGELANRLMHPRFAVEREYAVRVQGTMSDEQMRMLLKQGIELDDGKVVFEKVQDEGGEGFNHWYRVMLKEGRNRVVRRSFDALGLPVSRLIRVRFGIVNLPPRLKRGMTAELGEGEVAQVLEWLNLSDAAAAPQAEPVVAHETPAPARPPAPRPRPAPAGRGRSQSNTRAGKKPAGKTNTGIKR